MEKAKGGFIRNFRYYRLIVYVNIWLGDHWPNTSPVNIKPLVSPIIWFVTAFIPRAMKYALRNTPKAINMALQSSSTYWIIQEFVLTKEIYICFDNRRILYSPKWLSDVPFAAMSNETPHFVNFAFRVSLHLEPLTEKMHKQPGCKVDFITAMQAIRGASVTDLRDLVYSVLGLIAPGQANLMGTHYTLSFKQLCAKATFVSINTSQDFGILALVNLDKNEDQPSRAVDLSSTRT